MASPSRQERFQGLTDPASLLYFAIASYVLILIDTLLHRSRRLSDVRDDAFAQFWDWINLAHSWRASRFYRANLLATDAYGPAGTGISPWPNDRAADHYGLMVEAPSDPSQPLQGSATLIAPLLATAEGIVLELGPGSGAQVRFFKPASKIKKIYGAEPCVPLHKALLANAHDRGLGDKYAIVNAGAEKEYLIPGLAKAGLLAKASDEGGVFDTIVCVRVLCSVVNLKETGETLYKLLKPGGKLLVCEHVENPWWTAKGSYLARGLQTVYSLLGWTFFVGNCHLTRQTGQALVEAANPYGGWDDVDLSTSFTWSCLPYASGTLVKRRQT